MRSDTAAFDREMNAVIGQLRRLAAPLPRTVALAAQTRALQYLDDQVYSTVPGKMYQRTGALKASVRVFLTKLGSSSVRMTLAAGEPYAAQVEQGNQLDYHQQQASGGGHVPRLSLAQLDALAQEIANGNPAADVEFGRSGLNYQAPGPFLTPAAAYGTLIFRQALTAAWNTVLTQDAAASKAKIKP